MLTLELARALRSVGVEWSPRAGDHFVVADRDMDDDVFVVSTMVVEVREVLGEQVLAFNGTTEWALDSVEAEMTIWLPREDQLRALLGGAFVSLESTGGGTVPDGFVVSTTVGGTVRRHVEVTADAAYARALLDLLA